MTQRLRRSAAIAAAAVSVGLTVLAPSASAAWDYPWASGASIPPGYAKHSTYGGALVGVYCDVREASRRIEVAAVSNTGNGFQLYGSYVNVGSEGWRTYSGTRALAGACRNPHSVWITYNARDRFL